MVVSCKTRMNALFNLTSSTTCTGCCMLVENRASASGFFLPYQNIVSTALILFALLVLYVGVFLLVRVQLFHIYLAFLLFTCFALTLELMLLLIPPVLIPFTYYDFFQKVVYALTIYFEWLIQVGAVVFLWQEDPQTHLKRVVLIDVIFSTSLLIPW